MVLQVRTSYHVPKKPYCHPEPVEGLPKGACRREPVEGLPKGEPDEGAPFQGNRNYPSVMLSAAETALTDQQPLRLPVKSAGVYRCSNGVHRDVFFSN